MAEVQLVQAELQLVKAELWLNYEFKWKSELQRNYGGSIASLG